MPHSKKKSAPPSTVTMPLELIERRIYLIRGQKVMLDGDLAFLYGVETKALTRTVRRNLDRFPDDFMFQLSKEEFESLRCQFGTSKEGTKQRGESALKSQIVTSRLRESRVGRRYYPYVFTEQGVAMLASVLRSKRAVEVNIAIVRVFVRLREIFATHKDLANMIQEHDAKIEQIFLLLQKLLNPPKGSCKYRVGFRKR